MANPGPRCLRRAVIPALEVYNLARKTRLTPIKEQKGEQQRPRIFMLKKGYSAHMSQEVGPWPLGLEASPEVLYHSPFSTKHSILAEGGGCISLSATDSSAVAQGRQRPLRVNAFRGHRERTELLQSPINLVQPWSHDNLPEWSTFSFSVAGL